MTEFHLVRHGQASFGTDDYDRLSPLGEAQAIRLGVYFRHIGTNFDAVLSGNMKRQVQTAEQLLKGMKTRLTADIQTGLNECDMHGVVDAYLHQFPEEQGEHQTSAKVFFTLLKKSIGQWREGRLDPALLPETWEGFKQRVAAVLEYLQAEYAACNNVLLVSSGGVISMCACELLRTEDKTMPELNVQIRNTAVTRGFFNRQVMRLSSFNELPHLTEPSDCDYITYI